MLKTRENEVLSGVQNNYFSTIRKICVNRFYISGQVE